MSPQAQHRVCRGLSFTTTVGQAIIILDEKSKVIKDRQYETTTLALERALRLSEIYKCKRIMDEL